MQYAAATAAEIKQAQTPHNLFVSGLFLFDLLMAPSAIILEAGMAALLLPLSCSGALLAYIYLRSTKSGAGSSPPTGGLPGCVAACCSWAMQPRQR